MYVYTSKASLTLRKRYKTIRFPKTEDIALILTETERSFLHSFVDVKQFKANDEGHICFG